LGIKEDRYRIAETHGRLSTPIALMLSHRFGVSLDWLYKGEATSLTLGMAKRLGVLPTAMQPR
jgi:hypothetical protein